MVGDKGESVMYAMPIAWGATFDDALVWQVSGLPRSSCSPSVWQRSLQPCTCTATAAAALCSMQMGMP